LENAINALVWTLSIGLAAVYAITGTTKLVASRERLLAAPGMGWVEGTPMSRVRVIGALEVAGAFGLVVPWASGILSFLTPLAGWGLAAVQLGAIWTHLIRGEREHLWLNVLLVVAAVVVAIGPTIGG
jgi:hypothetical protein